MAGPPCRCARVRGGEGVGAPAGARDFLLSPGQLVGGAFGGDLLLIHYTQGMNNFKTSYTNTLQVITKQITIFNCYIYFAIFISFLEFLNYLSIRAASSIRLRKGAAVL